MTAVGEPLACKQCGNTKEDDVVDVCRICGLCEDCHDHPMETGGEG